MKSHGFRDTGKLDRRPARPNVEISTTLARLMQNLAS
jgi:hypothetical protein